MEGEKLCMPDLGVFEFSGDQLYILGHQYGPDYTF
jgi:hypothetical protein